ncbi:outer membrane channel protein [Geotalea uraniireducens]|uniref:Outer membrane channel protein n=1 Tax=Geotalea uraniireducens TaxID=351604 RepID=A0ABM8EP46_9BACT|nr:selenite/tellurite reduction operon porin ExtI [Geotalea uraniireducens]BDV44359.1 outer membrane channel protein [Geotalea uraniireducens]
MIKISRSGKVSALALGLTLMAGTAFAGPRITFGPEDQGALQIDYKGQFQMTVRDTGSGSNNDDTTTNFNFRRNRLAFMGKYGDMLSLYVQTEFTEDANVGTLGVASTNQGTEFQLLDAVMRFKLNDMFHVNVGKFKYNLSRENLEACEMPLTLDRSLFIRAPYVTTRDTGVAVWGNLFNDIFQYRIDAMEGRKAVSGDTAPDSNFRYSFRAHVTLLDPEKDYGYKGTYLGQKKVLTIGGAYQFEPKVAYGDTVAQTGEKDYKAWTIDGFFEYPFEGIGTVTASAAYEDVDLDDAYKYSTNFDSGTVGLNGQKNGWYVKAGYMLPNLPLQFFGRYEKWRFAELNNIFDQKVDWYAAGANYYLRGQNLKLTFEFSHTNFDQEGVYSGIEGANLQSKDFNTFITQLQLIF